MAYAEAGKWEKQKCLVSFELQEVCSARGTTEPTAGQGREAPNCGGINMPGEWSFIHKGHGGRGMLFSMGETHKELAVGMGFDGVLAERRPLVGNYDYSSGKRV